MKEYTPTETLEEEIRTNNIKAIKSGLTNVICFDPTFRTNKFELQLKYIEDKGINIRDPYKERDEYRLKKEDWTKEYFFLLVEWLRQNFAIDERIEHVKEVGRFIFKEDKQSGPPSGIPKKKPVNELAEKKLKICLLTMVIAIVLVIIGVKYLGKKEQPLKEIYLPEEGQSVQQN